MTTQNDRNIAAADRMIDHRNTLACLAGQADAMASSGPSPMDWTLVTERLPDDDEVQCLVSEIEGGVPLVVNAWFYDGKTGHNADDNGPYWADDWDGHIRHPYAWMPWPEPMPITAPEETQ